MTRVDNKITKALDAFLNADYDGCSKEVLLNVKTQLETYLGNLNNAIKLNEYNKELKALREKYGIKNE